MLQAMQLSRLNQAYAAEVAELRVFLSSAGLPVVEPDSLRAMTTRLTEDRSFHRDLVSYVWLLGDRQDGMRSADLLGVLALAAAGERFAVGADEESAHRLLRFVMEARRALAVAPVATPASVDAAASPVLRDSVAEIPASIVEDSPALRVPAPLAVEADSRELEAFIRQQLSSPRQAAEDAHPGIFRRNRVAIASVAACLVAAAAFGIWHPQLESGNASRPSATGETTTSPAFEAGLPAPPEAAPSDATVLPGISRRSYPSFAPSPRQGRTTMGLARPSAAVRAAMTPAPVTRSSPPLPAAAEVVRMAPPGAAPSTVAATPSRAASAMTPPGVVSNAVLNSRLQRTVDTAAYDPAYATDPAHPQLHRRPAAGSNFVAAAEPYASPVDLDLSGRARNPIVRQTSLGMMAANLVYSPAPRYPAQASAMHVQGQVTLQTEIDREGNVASARVISGPPLLREAALESVLQWRYRPYTRGSKRVPASATAVLDFELP